jgi:hypothetical protein
MSDQRLTALTELTTVADGDFVYVVDVSDTTDGAAGSSKKAQAKNVRGYPVTAAETSAAVSIVNYQYEPGNVLRYGTNTTPGTTDMSAAIQAAISVVETMSPTGTVFFPSDTYKIDTGLTVLDCSIDCERGAKITVDASVAAGLTVGSSSASCDNKRMNLPDIAPSTRDWDSTPTIGTQRGYVFKAMDSSVITVGTVEDFSYGIVLEGDTNGVSYNTFTLTRVTDNAIGLYFSNVNGGWSNQNTFLGGRFGITTALGGSPPFAGTSLISMVTPANNNTFIGCGLEGDGDEFAIDCDGLYNRWINCRWEGATPTARWGANAQNNIIDGGYESEQLVITAVSGADYNSVYTPRVNQIQGSDASGVLQISNASTDTKGVALFAGDEDIANKTSSEWTVNLSASQIQAKAEGDTYARFHLNNTLGRLHMGLGSSDPTSNGYLRFSGGFWEFNDSVKVKSGPLVTETVTTLDDTGTPSVVAGNLFKTGGTTAITDFDDGVVGQTIRILAAHSVTITDGTPIILAGGANFSMVATDTLTLTMFDDQVWQEVSRSVN